MSTPKRIQLSRKRGWRMPQNAVKVDRSTKWGNPFTVAAAKNCGFRGGDSELRALCVEAFRGWLAGHTDYQLRVEEDRRAYILAHVGQLRGLDLACWCPLDWPCHADVLLDVANAPVEGDEASK